MTLKHYKEVYMMKCPHCGKEIADNRHTCPYCREIVGPPSNAWYTKWWIWVLAAVAVGSITLALVLAFGGCDNQSSTPKAVPATAFTAPATESTTAPGKTMDQIVAEGYEKIGPAKLFNNINKYKGKKVLTAIVAKDLGTDAVYATLEEKSKTLTNYKFNLADASELKNIKKGDYVALYGTVSKNGSVSGTIDVGDCHVAAAGSAAKLFYDTLKDDKTATTAPTTKATTAPTTAPATKATTAPTTVPATTVAPTKATQPTTVPDGKLLFNENNITVSYVEVNDGDAYVTLKLHYDNKSDTDYYINTENSTVNGIDIPLTSEYSDIMGSGQSGDATLYLLRSDLDNAGISSVNELRFRFVFNDSEDWQRAITSKEIVINP